MTLEELLHSFIKYKILEMSIMEKILEESYKNYEILKKNKFFLKRKFRELLSMEIINEKYEIEITNEDIFTLRSRKWLNDKIINFYFEMLKEYGLKNGKNIYVFNTFFTTFLKKRGISYVQKWVENVNLFEYDLIFIPVHLTSHWVFVYIDLKLNIIFYFDSLRSRNSEVVEIILKFIKHVEKLKTGTSRVYKLSFKKRISQQKNSDDCGVFTCMYAKNVIDEDCGFIEYNIPMMRIIMAIEIYEGIITYKINEQFDGKDELNNT